MPSTKEFILMSTPEEIWHDDLLGRREEAEHLMAYIESIQRRPLLREDARSYTIAIDAPYGQGKTFFLRHLHQHLSLNHPVAFVDAWTDDLADEPLTALAATLKKALTPLLETSSAIEGKWESVTEKAGKVAKIVALGLLRKAVATAITGVAADQLAELLSGTTEAFKEAARESVQDIGDDTVAGAAGVLKIMSPVELMSGRIKEFEAGQKAISELKASLSALVTSLNDSELSAPIIIIIDELDRCRPTYAVKLLEEIKHLFDVPGILFIFGMNGEQLGHSLSGAYGPNFDGRSYLRRFVNRQYSIKLPDLFPLISSLIKKTSIQDDKFYFPSTKKENSISPVLLPEILSKLMKSYRLGPRSAFHIVDMLKTCAALTGDIPLFGPYIILQILSRETGALNGELVRPTGPQPLFYINRPDNSEILDAWTVA
jgi:hypothetical protein